MVREAWLNLNGPWEFEAGSIAGTILVPYAPEAAASGIGHVGFMPVVSYRRTVVVPDDWRQRVLLHFQAVDYDAVVWVNGVQVGRHRGGFTPFTFDVTSTVRPGEEAAIEVRAADDHRPPQPRGKQTQLPENHSCFYTRTTGIWQTVWMESVPDVYLRRPRFTPDLGASTIRLEQALSRPAPGLRVRATLADDAGVIVTVERAAGTDFTSTLDLVIPPERVRLWGPGAGALYDVTIELVDGDGGVVDRVASYAGLRSVTIDGAAVCVNGEPVFQRLVLDQGYWPETLMTAPSDADLRLDIELSMAAGFNGARLHQKVFEERFLYHADRAGYLVWGEFADWGCRTDAGLEPGVTFVGQWLEAVERDYSHPSIVGWCPLNETAEELTDRFTPLDDATLALFLATKAADRTRPVLDTSGYAHRVGEADVWDCHDYDQDPVTFAARHGAGAGWENGPAASGESGAWNVAYRGQPFMVSEFGGIRWNPEEVSSSVSWGYGDPPRTLEEFYERFEGLCVALLDHPGMFGYCYTQLTDVFQEQNGVYRFDRSRKFDVARLAAVQRRRAAVERRP
jgi:beta-galactosidase/beta-glucuronidase